MARRHPNPRLVKIHRSYTIEEIAATLGVHKNTVRNWMRHGLEAIDSSRPTLILGEALVAFLQIRRRANKQRCKSGEMFCVRCRAPVTAAGNMADYLPLSATSGNLSGICPHCENLIYRRVSLAQLNVVRGVLDIAFPQAEERIRERDSPSVDCDAEPTD